jgi:hypothetical protein
MLTGISVYFSDQLLFTPGNVTFLDVVSFTAATTTLVRMSFDAPVTTIVVHARAREPSGTLLCIHLVRALPTLPKLVFVIASTGTHV